VSTRGRQRAVRWILTILTIGAFGNSYRHGVQWVQGHSPQNGDQYSPYGIAAIPEALMISAALILADHPRSRPAWVVGSLSVIWTVWVNGAAADSGVSGMVVALTPPSAALLVLWTLGHGRVDSGSVVGTLGPVVTDSDNTLGPVSPPVSTLGLLPEPVTDSGNTLGVPSPPVSTLGGNPEYEPPTQSVAEQDPEYRPDPPRVHTGGDTKPRVRSRAATAHPESTAEAIALSRVAAVIANGIPSIDEIMAEYDVSRGTAVRYRRRARRESQAKETQDA
jgi:hypothetical protein